MRHTPLLSLLFQNRPAIAKYLVAGSLSTGTQLGGLYLFVRVFALHYLFATSLAFILAISVSFILHKFWTFEDASLHAAHVQFLSHVALGIGNLFVNGALMYLSVEKALVPLFGPSLHALWYVVAQAVTALIIAAESFIVYRFVIFGMLARIEKDAASADAR